MEGAIICPYDQRSGGQGGRVDIDDRYGWRQRRNAGRNYGVRAVDHFLTVSEGVSIRIRVERVGADRAFLAVRQAVQVGIRDLRPCLKRIHLDSVDSPVTIRIRIVG